MNNNKYDFLDSPISKLSFEYNKGHFLKNSKFDLCLTPYYDVIGGPSGVNKPQISFLDSPISKLSFEYNKGYFLKNLKFDLCLTPYYDIIGGSEAVKNFSKKIDLPRP